ncbi:type I phosphomannose isomerase catalytic subunit [Alkalibaculum sporogenes]|uniref:type I phosphomannose isomerase catalytic subunit n=1 Tax=Alkalibaculum sporogenes TaxID=2655001 RepID=UPI00128E4CC0|nr:type I phosphomannose isomerase catalytic subunit [Alkalibaculum sporogenes]
MLILKGISVPTVWGGQKLYSYGGDKNITQLGQLYTVAANDGLSSIILNGKYKGDNLRNIYKSFPEIFGKSRYTEFPLLIGFVDAKEDLSLQVHPDNEYCRKYEGKEIGKCESWIFLDQPANKYIYNGCKVKTKEAVQKNIDNTAWNNIIDTLSVEKDQYVYVEAGTLHALTSGSFVYEIQQSTNITYRFYDYDRIDSLGNKRPLQLNKALDVLDVMKRSEATDLKLGETKEEPYYSIKLCELQGQFKNDTDIFICVTLLEGRTTFEGVDLHKGMSFILFMGEEVAIENKLKCVIASVK